MTITVFTIFTVFHSAALESISTNRGVQGHLFMGGTTSVHERTKKILGPPPWKHCAPPHKSPFFEKILIPFLNFF